MSYPLKVTQSSLWANGFAPNELDPENEYINRLKVSLEGIRSNVQPLLDSIYKDFSNLTIHDQTHLDSLWVTGSTIAGKEYRVNPLEAYVFGVSILLHDCALSYTAFGGKESLRGSLE